MKLPTSTCVISLTRTPMWMPIMSTRMSRSVSRLVALDGLDDDIAQIGALRLGPLNNAE